ncbi:MAG: type VI secretion system tip protein VgrG, partial [Marivirga sp.]|nr:type VI secretion system tip protein VgrG [Marivirga sp.]
HAPGKVEFKASAKELGTPQSVINPTPKLPKAEQIASNNKTVFSQQFDLSHLAFNHVLGFSSETMPYEVFDKTGTFITSGMTNGEGMTQRIFTNEPTDLIVFVGDGFWQVEEHFESQSEDGHDSGIKNLAK